MHFCTGLARWFSLLEEEIMTLDLAASFPMIKPQSNRKFVDLMTLRRTPLFGTVGEK